MSFTWVATEQDREYNCTTMLNKVIETRQALLDKGVPEHALLYICRNSPRNKLGALYYTLDEIKESIEGCRRIEIIPKHHKTTYDCFAIDGRDTQSIKDSLDDIDEHDLKQIHIHIYPEEHPEELIDNLEIS
jgi:hypothetical protein